MNDDYVSPDPIRSYKMKLMPDWINVSERLPPKDKPFLGYARDSLGENTFITSMIWYEGGEDDNGYDMEEGFYALGEWGGYNREWDCEPTHWMPLPNPPVINEMD